MNEETNADKIRAFHRAMDAYMADRPHVPPADILALRRTLINEEHREVGAALTRLTETGSDEDLAALAHELTDLLYVTYGALAALGVDADAVFAEVHAANMRKLEGPRRADGKVLKPDDWTPADVARVIEKMKA